MDKFILFFCLIFALKTASGAVQADNSSPVVNSPVQANEPSPVVNSPVQDEPSSDLSSNEEELPQNAVGASGATVKARVIVDDKMEVYADGVLVRKNAVWNLIQNFDIPATTTFIALKAENMGGPWGIKASFKNGKLFTNNKWRCTPKRETDWSKPSFDASHWGFAHEMDSYKGGKIAGEKKMDERAKWIWNSKTGEDRIIYCRAFIDIDGFVRVDDKLRLYADGKFLGGNGNNWRAVASFNIPGDTRVIAIRGINGGGPYGIKASFDGSRLITDSTGQWRCTNTHTADWEKPTFNDQAWISATTVAGPRTGKSGAIDKTAAKWIWSTSGKKPAYCRAFLNMFAILVVDDRMRLYADGNFIGKNVQWNVGVRFRIPGGTQLIAISALNTGGPRGIIGYFGTGRLVTNAQQWKCKGSATPILNWEKLTYDDSTWKPAKELVIGQHPRTPLNKFKGSLVTPEYGSKWIWSQRNHKKVYCRGYIRKVAAASDTNVVAANTPPTEDEQGSQTIENGNENAVGNENQNGGEQSTQNIDE